MSEMQSPAPAATAVPAMPDAAVAASMEEPDFALGCECAYPTLQIERWWQEARAGAGDPA